MIEQIFQTLVSYITHPFVLVMLGLLLHFIKEAIDMNKEQNVRSFCITAYLRERPLQSAFSSVAAVIGYALLVHFPDFDKMAHEVQNVVRMTAFGVGYMSDSVITSIGNKALRKADAA